jgi:hypothetical protein
MRNLLFPLVLALAVLSSTRPAAADFMLTFDQPTYSVVPGGIVDVAVFLNQTAGGTQIGPDNLLVSAGIRLTFDLAPVPGDPAVITSDSAVASNPAFPLDSVNVEPNQYADLALLTFDGVNVDSQGRIYLGTFTFTAGSVIGEVTQIGVAEIPVGDNFSTTGGDIFHPSAATATITAVAEPASACLAILGLPGVALIVHCGRSRKR